MTGPEQERTPLDLLRLEAHLQAVLSAGLPATELKRHLYAARPSDDHPAFHGLIEALRSEPVLEALDCKIMNTGGGGSVFNLRKLAFWLVTRSLKDGIQDALASLSTWVAQDHNDGFEIVLLSGVTIQEPLSLCCDISLTPIEALPHRPEWEELRDARSKLNELVSFNTPFTYSFQCLLPSAALVRPIKFRPPAGNTGELRKIKPEYPPLEHLCWCFAALECCWPQPYMCYGILADSVPAGDLLGGGHKQPLPHYALGSAPPPLQEGDRARAQCIFERFNALSASWRERLLPALEWLSLAKRRWRMEQSIVDLAIVLESLLIPDCAEQISLAVRTRGAWLLGTNYEERRKIHDLIRAIYDARSDVVHGRRIKKSGRTKLDGRDVHVGHIIPDATRLCERAVIHMIQASRDPDWTDIILGQDEDDNE